MQVPLNYVLYETQVSSIQLWVTREFVQQGYLLIYSNGDLDSGNSYGGGYIKNIDESLVYKPQFLVAEGDFFSLYPTVIVAHNISPETLTNSESAQFVVNANVGKSNEVTLIGFSGQQPGVLPEMIKPLLEIRNNE